MPRRRSPCPPSVVVVAGRMGSRASAGLNEPADQVLVRLRPFDASRLVSSDASPTPSRVGGHVLDAGGPRRRLELQPFEPRVAGLGDPDLEAVDAGLELAVRRDPDG